MSTTKSVGTLYANKIMVDSSIEASSLTATSFTVNGSQTISGGLTVGGTTTIIGSSTVGGGMSISGSLYVGGGIEFDGTLSGNIPGTGFTPYDDLSVGTLDVSNRIIFEGLVDDAPIRIGKDSGIGVGVSNESIAIGNDTGGNAGVGSIAVGEGASTNNAGKYSIAIGYDAGQNGLADNSIAIGHSSAPSNQTSSSSIIINATGVDLDPLNDISGQVSGFFVKPLRNISGDTYESSFVPMYYNPTTGEIGYKK